MIFYFDFLWLVKFILENFFVSYLNRVMMELLEICILRVGVNLYFILLLFF